MYLYNFSHVEIEFFICVDFNFINNISEFDFVYRGIRIFRLKDQCSRINK